GSYKKWYGNNEYVVNWLNDGEELRAFKNAVIRNPLYYFREGITWGTVASTNVSFRYTPSGFIYGNKGNGLFSDERYLWNILALANSKVIKILLEIIAPTMSIEAGYVSRLPISNFNSESNLIEQNSKNNVSISKSDWDSFETSW